MKFFTTTLTNGLTVIGEQRESAVSVAMGFFVQTGARDEKPDVAGVSHFLEHMMFKGTAKRSALDITYELGAIGAQANAYTSEENTVYYMAVLPEYFPRGIELLSDMLRPALDPTEFDVEKKVILEEIALYQDRPTFVLFETAMRSFFGDHPAGNSVLGSIDSITALPAEQMRQYFNSRYTASNIVLAATGNFEWKELVRFAEQYCSHWPSTQATRERPVHIAKPVTKEMRKAEMQRAHICYVAPGPSAAEEERYAAEVLSCIMGDGSGSRLFWDLIDKGLADSATIDTDDMDGTGMLYGYASASPSRIDQVAEILLSVLKTPKEFDDAALERAITKIGTRMVLQGESSMRRLMAIGTDWIYRKEYVTLQDELQRIKSVDRQAIGRLLERYSFTPTAELRLLPE